SATARRPTLEGAGRGAIGAASTDATLTAPRRDEWRESSALRIGDGAAHVKGRAVFVTAGPFGGTVIARPRISHAPAPARRLRPRLAGLAPRRARGARLQPLGDLREPVEGRVLAGSEVRHQRGDPRR